MASNADLLFHQGVDALGRGDLATAEARLRSAETLSPGEAIIPLTRAVVHRQRGQADAEHQAIDAALAVDAYFLPALLAKAEFLERQGVTKAAATAYTHALTVAPPEPHWPQPFRAALQHGRRVVDAHQAAFAAHLDGALAEARRALAPAELERWVESASIMTGRTRPYRSESNQLHVPRLPAIPFHDRALFPWVEALEARTEEIRAELGAALEEQGQAFTPYITYRPGDPVNQWRELNHSARWSTYPLWRGGEPVEEHLERCPRTRDALQQVEMAEIGGLCPNAMFSALAPRTAIPPHHGETNARLVVHLPLVVPAGCTYRVGFEQRRWTVGKVLIFDDTLEHEARNDGDALRVVLIFDVWNPFLSPAERAMVQATTAAARRFGQED